MTICGNSVSYKPSTYFRFMREVSKAIVPDIREMVVACRDLVNGNLGRDVSATFKRRCSGHRPKLRPFIAAVCSGASGGANLETHIRRVGAAVELINISTYYANLAFDGKGNREDKSDTTTLCLAAMLLRDSVFASLAKRGLGNASTTTQVIATLSKGYLDVSKGQFLDIHKLSGFDGRVLPTPDYHLQIYIERCALLGGGSLMAVCLAGGLVGGMDTELLVKMALYGWWHGTALQVINDIADFAPVFAAGKSIGKTDTDRYADLRACKLTLPNYHLCKDVCDGTCNFRKMNDFVLHELPVSKQRQLLHMRIFEESLLLAAEADTLAAESICALPLGIGQILYASLIVSKENRFFDQLQCYVEETVPTVAARERIRKVLSACSPDRIPSDDGFLGMDSLIG